MNETATTQFTIIVEPIGERSVFLKKTVPGAYYPTIGSTVEVGELFLTRVSSVTTKVTERAVEIYVSTDRVRIEPHRAAVALELAKTQGWTS